MGLKILVIVYFAVLALASLVAFALFGVDKRKAGREAMRIKERTLLAAAAYGGAVGALIGRLAFRHKTRKIYFSLVIVFSLLCQISAGALLLLLLGGVL